MWWGLYLRDFGFRYGGCGALRVGSYEVGFFFFGSSYGKVWLAWEMRERLS